MPVVFFNYLFVGFATKPCSKTFIFTIFCYILAIVIPFFLVFNSNSKFFIFESLYKNRLLESNSNLIRTAECGFPQSIFFIYTNN